MKLSVDIPELPGTWTIVHVLYTSLEARMKLLTTQGLSLLPQCDQVKPWFFADVPIDTTTGSYHALEVALLQPTDDEAKCVGARLSDSITAGLSLAALFAPASVVIQPEFFLGKFIPDQYPNALAIASARARAILTNAAKFGCIRASSAMVRGELAAIYRAFLPNASERPPALLFHAQWLKSLGRQRTGPVSESRQSTAQPGADFAELDLALLQPYDTVAEHLRSQLARVTAETCGSGVWDYSTMSIALLARFAHIQVVRLWGPEYPDAFFREAEILHALAAKAAVLP